MKNLPGDGGTVYVRFFVKVGGTWNAGTDYQYTACGDCGGGGGTEPEIVSPEPGATLSGTTETFSWVSNGATVGKYRLWVGTSVGARNIYDSGGLANTVTSRTVKGLPGNGGTVYVRLRIKNDGVWGSSTDYRYTACSCGGGGGGGGGG